MHEELLNQALTTCIYRHTSLVEGQVRSGIGTIQYEWAYMTSGRTKEENLRLGVQKGGGKLRGRV